MDNQDYNNNFNNQNRNSDLLNRYNNQINKEN